MELVIKIALVMIVGLMVWILGVNVNNALVRKDCAKSVYMFETYGVMPEEKLVQTCAEHGFEMLP